MIKWHQATGKPVLMADGAARRETIKDESGKYRDGAYSTVDGKWYADVVAGLLKNPGAIGAHLCGAYIRNRYRGRGLIDEMERPDQVAIREIRKGNQAVARCGRTNQHAQLPERAWRQVDHGHGQCFARILT
jgi:hypothetical protein